MRANIFSFCSFCERNLVVFDRKSNWFCKIFDVYERNNFFVRVDYRRQIRIYVRCFKQLENYFDQTIIIFFDKQYVINSHNTFISFSFLNMFVAFECTKSVWRYRVNFFDALSICWNVSKHWEIARLKIIFFNDIASCVAISNRDYDVKLDENVILINQRFFKLWFFLWKILIVLLLYNKHN